MLFFTHLILWIVGDVRDFEGVENKLNMNRLASKKKRLLIKHNLVFWFQ